MRHRLAALGAGFGLCLGVLGCAKVVVPKAPAVAVDLLRIELFYAGRIDPNLHYIVAMNRQGLAANGLEPKSIVSGNTRIGENWTDAIIYHQGFWTYYTGNNIRLNQTGEPLDSNRLNTILRWDARVETYLPDFGLIQKVLPQGGGKLTLELCKTFFSVPSALQSQTTRCTALTGATPTTPTVAFHFMVSPQHPDRNGSFQVLDALPLNGPPDFQIRTDADLNPQAAGRLIHTPNINILGHNSDYERLDANPADGVPDDLNQTYGTNLADADSDTFPDAVETALETNPQNAASVPTFQGLPVTLPEVMHPSDLSWWRLRQVQPNQQ